ncbi:MAG: response regulator [Salinivirgaceae bacterium]|nr:response regulator [Salinivirgaceae bacterium]
MWEKEKDTNDLKLLGDYIKIIVRDNGIGIPNEQCEKVFERFYQAENVFGHSGGSGIGLALIKDLVGLLNGKIKLNSELGVGTCFTIWLPIGLEVLNIGGYILEEKLPQNVDITQYEYNNELTETSEYFGLSDKPLILVVEDNYDMEKYITSILQSDFNILTANNGRIGLELAMEHIPDLIVSDVIMPILDGMEMCKTLRKKEHTSHIPIILLNARAKEEYQMEGFVAGADDYITKPFSAKILLLRVNNIIKSRQLMREKYSLVNTSIGTTFMKSVENIIDDKIYTKGKKYSGKSFR